MKKTTLLIALLCAALGAFGQTTEDEWYEKAVECLDSGDYTNALTVCSETIRRNSSNLDAYWLRSIAYYRLKNYDAVIADCDTVIKGAPDFPLAYVVRGDAYGAKGVYHKAVADYRTGFEKGYEHNGELEDKSSKASMWFCGAMYMEITINRFLGKADVVTAYENRLKTVCDKSGVTRAEVEAFYRQNIGALIAGVVDEEFGKVSFMVKTDTDSANVKLIRNPNEYVLICDGYWGNPKKEEIKQFSASSLDALLTVMRNSSNFSATAFNVVREQAALIPATRLDNKAISGIADILTNLYLHPTDPAAYDMVKAVYSLYENQGSRAGDNVFKKIETAYDLTLYALSVELEEKVVRDWLQQRQAYTALTSEQQRMFTSLQR